MHLTDKAFPLDDSYSDTLRFISLIPRATALPPASVEVQYMDPAAKPVVKDQVLFR